MPTMTPADGLPAEGQTFRNQLLTETHAGAALVTVWHAADVAAFRWHDVMIHAAEGTSHRPMRVHGVSVEPRHVWHMIAAVHETPCKAIMRDGSEVWCGAVYLPDGSREIRLGADAKAGRAVARVTLQSEWIEPGRAA